MQDLDKFVPLVVEKSYKKGGGRRGSLTIICSKKNGKRLVLSPELLDMLELKDNVVQLGFIGKALLLGSKLPGTGTNFELKRQGKKAVLYSAEVVRVIAQMQKIPFENHVSFTWYKPKVDEYENSPVVIFEPEGGDNCEE